MSEPIEVCWIGAGNAHCALRKGHEGKCSIYSGKDCIRCDGLGSERWIQYDGTEGGCEMSQVCPRCGGFGREP